MPNYSYRCPECGGVSILHRTIDDRDVLPTCQVCEFFSDRTFTCARVPDAPNFSIGGFNAKNGYSKGS